MSRARRLHDANLRVTQQVELLLNLGKADVPYVELAPAWVAFYAALDELVAASMELGTRATRGIVQ